MNFKVAAAIASGMLLLAIFASPACGQTSFDDCDANLDAGPDSEAGAKCYERVARSQGDDEEAVRRLGDRIRSHPAAPWPHFHMGNILMGSQPCEGGSEASYREAIRLFVEREELDNEARARTSLTWLLLRCAFFERATPELAKAEVATRRSSDPLAILRLELVVASLQIRTDGDLEASYEWLGENWERVSEPSLDDLPTIWPLRRGYLRALVNVCLDLGRFSEVKKWREQFLLWAKGAGQPRDIVAAEYGLVLNPMTEDWPSEKDRKELLQGLWSMLPRAQEASHGGVEAMISWRLAKMTRGSEAEHFLERCQQIAEEQNVGHLRRKCAFARASHRLEDDPASAKRLLSDIYAADFFGSDDARARVDGWDDHFRVLWQTHPRDEALRGIERVLEAIESFRRPQLGMARVDILELWSDAYYWLAGRLLNDATGDDDLRRALHAIERLRSQELREILFMSRPDTGLGLVSPPDDVWDQVVAALGGNEAMLSFQLSLWEDFNRRFAGGAWVLVTTRERSWVRRLEVDGVPVDRVLLEPLVKRLGDSQNGQNGGWDSPDVIPTLVTLHKALLGSILEELPPGIDRLTLVPDGGLHLLPFAALRSAPDAPALAESYEISIEPSATLWLNWKNSPDSGGGSSALVLADPEIPPTVGVGLGDRVPSRGQAFEPLPHARHEGQKVLAHLGGGGLLLRGREASEQFLKQADLQPYGLIHFATHAVADNDSPWRSHVVLASDERTEDGFLYPDEIAELDFNGKAVILSACDSAGGRLRRSEGVMSLARAFFKAGAPAVVGTLKPLQDDQGERFFDDFYLHLSHGSSLRQALAATQRQWIADGLPASTWANVVVLGNGDLVPAPRFPWVLGALSGCFLMAALLGLRYRRER